MLKTVGRGMIAGAAGVTALNWVGYADMALRGRPASDTPGKIVASVLKRLDQPVPDEPRLSALGELSGMKVGVLVGVGAALTRAAGVRLPAPIASVLIGGAAMGATDTSVALLGISDPRTWTAADWLSDVVPHLAYGAVTHATLTAFEATEPRSRTRLARRSFALGWASGGRTSFGPVALALTSRKPVTGLRKARSYAGLLAATGEVVVDKLPTTPSRLEPQVLGGRIAAGAGVGGGLAHREKQSVWVPAAVGAAGAAAGSYAGVAWRRWAATRVPDWQAAVAEDVVTLLVARYAVKAA
jgi:uncharacterized membrane protein